MKSFIHKAILLSVIIHLFPVNQTYSQVVADTFGVENMNVGFGPVNNTSGSQPNTKINTFVKYRADELAAKGIVPGVIIYGVAFHKNNAATLLPGATGTLTFNMRSGSLDTSFNLIGTTPINNVNYFYNNYLGGGFASYMQFNVPNDLTIPASPGWMPLMLDMPFVYTGGCLEYWSDWESPTQPMNGLIHYSNQPMIATNGISIYRTHNGATSFLSSRPTTVIYHSINPPACNGTPDGGMIAANPAACANIDFTLFLQNPAAGPGISYQWQSSPLSPVSWSNIPGATHTTYTANIAAPTQYRAQVTCANSAITTPSTIFSVNPQVFQIDSVSTSANANEITFTPHTNFPISNQVLTFWDFGTGDTGVGLPLYLPIYC